MVAQRMALDSGRVPADSRGEQTLPPATAAVSLSARSKVSVRCPSGEGAPVGRPSLTARGPISIALRPVLEPGNLISGQGRASRTTSVFDVALALSITLHIAALLASVSIARFPEVIPVLSADPRGVLKLTLVQGTSMQKRGSEEPTVTRRVAHLPFQDDYSTTHQVGQGLHQQRAPTVKTMTTPAVIAGPRAVVVPSPTTDTQAPSSDETISALTSARAEPMTAAIERGRSEMHGEVAMVPASTPATYLSHPKPEYPQQSREDREEGLVVLRVLISSEGRPASIQLNKSSGFRALDAAAVSGVKRWSFTPATQNQRAIEAWIDIPIRFRLDQNEE